MFSKLFAVQIEGKDGLAAVAETGRLHLHQHFAGAWTFELHFFDDERLIRAVHDGRADIQRHGGNSF